MPRPKKSNRELIESRFKVLAFTQNKYWVMAIIIGHNKVGLLECQPHKLKWLINNPYTNKRGSITWFSSLKDLLNIVVEELIPTTEGED